MEEYYLAIDDTDNLETRGTGYYSRQLAGLVNKSGLGKIESITRHQLFRHEDIPFTSQNSSACLLVNTDDPDRLWKYCRDYIVSIAADGSDAGICLAKGSSISDQVIEFGKRAKREVLVKEQAHRLASEMNIWLEGLTGLKIGVIGALAAVGLRYDGNDGRFIWLKSQEELRDIKPGKYFVGDIKSIFNFDAVILKNGFPLEDSQEIVLDDWVRPVLKEQKAVLIVENNNNPGTNGWKNAPKEYIRIIS